MQKIMYQVRYKEPVEVKGMKLTFSDALYYEKLPEQSVIDAEKSRRIANWKEMVENPPVQPEPTKEQLEAEQVALDEQIASMQARKVELSDKISSISVKPVVEEKVEG